MVDILKALADETRLRLVAILLEEPLCVCEIEACLNLTQSNVSRHLTVLKRAGILESYKMAQWVYYKINEDFMLKHASLYQYIVQSVKTMPSYETDYSQYKLCKKNNLCGK